MLDFLNYTFIVRSLVVGGVFSVFAAFLGNFLVAGKKSNTADMLSHFSLAGVGLGIFLGSGVEFFAVLASIFASLTLYYISRNSRLSKEAFNTLILSFGLALAIFLVNIGPSSNYSLETYLFGSILTISKAESFGILSFITVAFVLMLTFYKRFLCLVVDPDLLKFKYKNFHTYEFLLGLICSIFVGLSLKVVGGLLVSAFLTISVLSAQQFAKSFKSSIYYSVLFNFIATITGIIFSFYYDIPTSSAIIFILILIFFIGLLLNKKSSYAK